MGLRFQPVTLYPVALMVIVIKLYPCYHQDGLEFIFSYPHSVAASMACTVVRHTGIVSCGLKQILGETSAHIENLLTVLLYSSLNQHQCLKKKKVNVQLHGCKLSTMYMCLQSVKNIPSILLGYIYKPPGTFLSPGSLEIVFK